MREEAGSPHSPYKEFILESIEKSVLLPPQLTTQLLQQEIQKSVSKGKQKFLLDGFPRNVIQAIDFELKVLCLFVEESTY